jgi:hypothetical protein
MSSDRYSPAVVARHPVRVITVDAVVAMFDLLRARLRSAGSAPACR